MAEQKTPSPKLYKTVLKPITVSNCQYCWERITPYRICKHFDNPGAHPQCDQGFFIERKHETVNGVLKPKECLELSEVKEG